MSMPLSLISHELCPYVQRAAIVLAEKGVNFERRDIDLGNKPDWFLKVSPLGKTPVLLVDGVALFESAVICEYLDDTITPRLHPQEPLLRAQHRAWIEFGSAMLNAIAAFYNAPDAPALQARARDLRSRLEQLEQHRHDQAGYFGGSDFSIVDATFGPVFRYFDVFEDVQEFGFFANLDRTMAWRALLKERPSVQMAVAPEYGQRLKQFLIKRGSALSACI